MKHIVNIHSDKIKLRLTKPERTKFNEYNLEKITVFKSDIFYAKVIDKNCIQLLVCYKGKKMIVYYNKSLLNLSKVLPEEFYRVSRNALVNVSQIESYTQKKVILGDESFLIAKRRFSKLMQKYDTYLPIIIKKCS